MGVYIPTFGRVALVERAIFSVLNQSYKHIKIHVVVDGPDTKTIELLERLSKAYSNLNFSINSKNKGACFCRNKAVEKLDTDFVTGLDDDDFISPNHIDSLLEKFLIFEKEKQEKSAVFPKHNVVKNHLDEKEKRMHFKVDKQMLSVGNYVGNQILIRKSDFIRYGGFDEKFPAWQDYEFWYRLAINGVKFYCSQQATYNVDLSHPHERVTKSKEKVIAAYHCFVEKHGKSDEMLIKNLTCNLIKNPDVKVKCSYLSLFIKSGSFFMLFKAILKRFLRRNAR